MVLVSHRHAFIFLKTHKTAGTSVEMALESACAPAGHVVSEKTPTLMSEAGIIGSRILPCELPPQPALEPGTWCNHKNAAEVKQDLGAERFNRYTKITAVRNPFDRCVSAFHWFQPKLAGKSLGFSDLRQEFRAYIKAQKWISDRKCVFVDRQFIIDRAIRFEHLHDDLKTLCSDLNIPVNTNAIPHAKSNQKSRKKYAIADYYDQESIDVVRKRARWVFRRFNYAEQP